MTESKKLDMVDDGAQFHRRRSSAFTLIEVLVVVGIVAILASMLLPSLSSAREQGRAVVCRSNIRQILLANGYYTED